MEKIELSPSQIRLVIACLDDRRDTVLRKIDHLRKTKDAVDDSLYEFINEGHQAELHLVRETVLSLQG